VFDKINLGMALQLIIDTSVAQVWRSFVVTDNRSQLLMNHRTIAITIMEGSSVTLGIIEFVDLSVRKRNPLELEEDQTGTG